MYESVVWLLAGERTWNICPHNLKPKSITSFTEEFVIFVSLFLLYICFLICTYSGLWYLWNLRFLAMFTSESSWRNMMWMRSCLAQGHSSWLTDQQLCAATWISPGCSSHNLQPFFFLKIEILRFFLFQFSARWNNFYSIKYDLEFRSLLFI